MTTNVQLLFADGSSPILDPAVFYLRYEDALNEPFALTLRLTSPDPAIVPSSVVGGRVVVELVGEPWLQRIPGIVASFLQKTALSGSTVGASIYELVVRPPLWLLSQRFARRIHQDVTAVDVVLATLGELGGIADPPQNRCARVLPVADVAVQYDETDLNFVRRVLSEAHLVGFFDASADHAWTLADNVTTAAAPLPTPLVCRPPSGLVPTSPHVLALSTEDSGVDAGAAARGRAAPGLSGRAVLHGSGGGGDRHARAARSPQPGSHGLVLDQLRALRGIALPPLGSSARRSRQ
jgi:uncharacterized protein involved in type VI secretion and phage assembly